MVDGGNSEMFKWDGGVTEEYLLKQLKRVVAIFNLIYHSTLQCYKK